MDTSCQSIPHRQFLLRKYRVSQERRTFLKKLKNVLDLLSNYRYEGKIIENIDFKYLSKQGSFMGKPCIISINRVLAKPGQAYGNYINILIFWNTFYCSIIHIISDHHIIVDKDERYKNTFYSLLKQICIFFISICKFINCDFTIIIIFVMILRCVQYER